MSFSELGGHRSVVEDVYVAPAIGFRERWRAVFARVAGHVSWAVVRRRVLDAGLLGAIAYVHLLFARAFTFGQIGFDEGYFLSEGFFLGKGLVPYRDFQEFKPPLVFVANMLAIKLFGLHGMRFRYFFTLMSLLAFAAVAIALLSRRTPRLVVLALGAIMLDHFFDTKFHEAGVINTSETIGVIAFLFGVAVLLFKTRRPHRLQQLIGGVLLALAPLGKEPLAVPTLFAWLSLLLLDRADNGGDRAATIAFVKRTVLGAASVAGVWLAYMLITRSLGWYILQLRETMVYTSDHNEMYGIFPKLPFWDACRESWTRLKKSYVNPATIGAFIPYMVAAMLLWRRNVAVMAGAVMATFLGGLYAVTIGHGFFGHYFIIAMSGTFFFAIMGALAFGTRVTGVEPRWRLWLGIFLCATTFYSLQPRIERERANWSKYQPQSPPVSDALVRFVREHSSPKDRIWNIGKPGIYPFSNRATASRIPFMHDSLLHIYPGKTEAERLAPYRLELDQTMPKLVIFGGDRKGREKHMDLLVMPFLNEHGYRLVNGLEVPVYERPY
jgi:hypothetical protein